MFLFLAGTLSLLCFLFFALFGFDYFVHRQKEKSTGDVPLINGGSRLSPCFRWKTSKFDWGEALQNAYNKYTRRGEAFAVTWDHPISPIILLPPQCGSEYYNLPKTHASFSHSVFQTMKPMGIIGTDWTTKIAAIHAGLRPVQMNGLGRFISTKLDDLLPQSLNESTVEWHSQVGVETVLDIVNPLITSLVFPQDFQGYSSFRQAFKAWEGALGPLFQVFSFPEALRPSLSKVLPGPRAYKSALEEVQKIMVPEIERQIKVMREYKGKSDIVPTPWMNLLIEQEMRKDANKEIDAKYLANRLIFMWEESVAPILGVATSMIFAAMRHHDQIEPLRKELEEALALCGGGWSFDIYDHTPKLESFTYEVLRLYPPSSVSGSRTLLKPLHLHSLGITLQPGMHVSLPTRYIQLDPDNYPNPTSFDGDRFLPDESSDTSTTTSASNMVSKPSDIFLPFGIGTSVCPARILGLRICQMILSKVLLGYDLGPIDSDVPFQVFAPGGETYPNDAILMTTRRR